MKMLAALLTGLLLVSNSYAATVVIDFEDVASGAIAPTSRGFNFSAGKVVSSYYGHQVLEICYDLATCYYEPGYPNSPSTISFSKQDSTLFDLISLQMSSSGCLCSPPASITGYFADGSSIQKNIVLGEGAILSSYTLGSGWTNLKSVSIYGTSDLSIYNGGPMYMQLDAITVSTVPIPAAIWLFASGLGLLGWLRRRHAA